MEHNYLEKFIIKNRNKWDDKKAPKLIWENISAKLDSDLDKLKSPWKNISILLLIVIGLLVTFYYVNNKPVPSAAKNPNEIIEYAELEDFEETERFYISSINVNYQKLIRYDIDATLEEDLRLLDGIYSELINEYSLAQGAYKEQILRAIIQNHKTKLQILENVLYHQEKHNEEIHREMF